MTFDSRLPNLTSIYRNRWTELKEICKTIFEDYAIAFKRDPAARNWLEVLLCYPGVQAILTYRLAHWLHELNIPFSLVFSLTSPAFLLESKFIQGQRSVAESLSTTVWQ